MAKKASGLTPKERKFVGRYLVHLNATKAAIEAGYSKKTARIQASQLLSKLNISEEVRKRMDSRAERLEISQDDVVKELGHMAFSRITDVMKWEEGGSIVIKASDTLTDAEAASIHSVKETKGEKSDSLELKKHDKLKALELLGKHMGMFKDAGPTENPDPEADDDTISDYIQRATGGRPQE